jgi:hypothetical protein
MAKKTTISALLKGDILWAKDTSAHKHPIVFLATINDQSFKACILSHSAEHGNIKMEASHFQIADNSGVNYQFQYENTHLVTSHSFVKMNNWIDSNPNVVGKLTRIGVAFIEKNIPQPPVNCPCAIYEFQTSNT